jgi:hypothetical protein
MTHGDIYKSSMLRRSRSIGLSIGLEAIHAQMIENRAVKYG